MSHHDRSPLHRLITELIPGDTPVAMFLSVTSSPQCRLCLGCDTSPVVMVPQQLSVAQPQQSNISCNNNIQTHCAPVGGVAPF